MRNSRFGWETDVFQWCPIDLGYYYEVSGYDSGEVWVFEKETLNEEDDWNDCYTTATLYHREERFLTLKDAMRQAEKWAAERREEKNNGM